MAHLQNSSISCGVKLLYGLSHDPLETLMGVWTSLSTMQCAWVLFSDDNGNRGCGLALAEFIKEKGIGTLDMTPEAINPNTDHTIQIWAWKPDKEKMALHLKPLIDNLNKRLEEAEVVFKKYMDEEVYKHIFKKKPGWVMNSYTDEWHYAHRDCQERVRKELLIPEFYGSSYMPKLVFRSVEERDAARVAYEAGVVPSKAETAIAAAIEKANLNAPRVLKGRSVYTVPRIR